MFCVISGSDSGFSLGVQGPPGPPGPPGPASGSLTVSGLIAMLQSEYNIYFILQVLYCIQYSTSTVSSSSSIMHHFLFFKLGCTKLNCVFALICPGDDVRRYLTGPPGPQGPPGPPGTSVGLSGSYRVEEIATYVFNFMNG